jgi:hypothetical protein
VVVETIAEREVISRAVLEAVRKRGDGLADAQAIAEILEQRKIDQETTLWTIWRLIDENRLFLDEKGYLTIEKPSRVGS